MKLRNVVILSSLSGLLAGCIGYYPNGTSTPLRASPLISEPSKGFRADSIYSVAVTPLDNSVGNYFPETLLENLTSDLSTALQVGTGFEVVNKKDPLKLAEVLKSFHGTSIVPQERARRIGEAVGADAVLYGVVTNYRESEGGTLGSKQLGAVGFRLWLFSQKENKIVWSGTYENSDRPLSENLYRMPEVMKEGVGFRSSSEIAKQGFEAAAHELERLRAVPPA